MKANNRTSPGPDANERAGGRSARPLALPATIYAFITVLTEELLSFLYSMCFPCCMLFSFYAGLSAMFLYLLGLGREDNYEHSDHNEDDETETIVHGDEHLYQITHQGNMVPSAETRRLVQERMQPWIPDAIRYQPPPRPASVAIMLSTSPEPMHCDYREPELPRPVSNAPSEAVYTIEPFENERSTNEGDRYPTEDVTHRDSTKEENRRSFKQAKKDSVLKLQEVCVLHV